MELETISAGILSAKGYKGVAIEGKVYSVKLLPATQGLGLALKLIKTFLPTLGAWADGEKKEGLILPEDNSMFSEMAILLVSQLDKVDIGLVVKQLLDGALVDNEGLDFETYFSANYSTLIELVEFAMKENFGDFFTNYLRKKGIDLKTLIPQGQGASESPSAEMENKAHTAETLVS